MAFKISARQFEAVHLAGFDPDEARKFFGEPTTASFDMSNFEQLIRPWPIHVAHENFVTEFNEISDVEAT